MSNFQSIIFDGVDFNDFQFALQGMQPAAFSQLNVQCPGEYKPAVPNVAAGIYNTSVQRAKENKIRSIYFNMVANPNTRELEILTGFVVNLAAMSVANGTYTNPDQALAMAMDWGLNARVNFVTVNNSTLMEYAGGQANDVMNWARDYVAHCNEVNGYMNSTYSNGTVSASSGFGVGNNRQTHQNHNVAATGFGNSGGDGFLPRGANSAKGFGNVNRNTGDSLASARSAIVSTSEAMVGVNSNFARGLAAMVDIPVRRAPEPAPAPTSMNQSAAAPSAPPAFDIMDYYKDDGSVRYDRCELTQETWRPTEKQSVIHGYDSRLFVEEKRLLPTSANTAVVIATLKAKNVDRSAHTLPSSQAFLAEIKPDMVGDKNVVDRDDFREKSLGQLKNELVKVRNIENETTYMEQLEQSRANGHLVFSQMFSSLQDAVSTSRQAATIFNNRDLGSYNTEFMLSTEFLIDERNLEMFTELGEMKTFNALAKRMGYHLADPKLTHVSRMAMVQLNAYLTERFTDFLRLYMAIDEFILRSFIDEFEDVIKIVGEEYGDGFKKQIVESQRKFIEQNLRFASTYKPKIKELSGMEMVTQDLVVLPVVSLCSLIVVEFLDSEFSIQLPDNISGKITPQVVSANLYEIIVNQLDKRFSKGLANNIQRFFFATMDNHIYEVTYGLNDVAPPTLIRKVN